MSVNISTVGDKVIDEKIREWLEWDKNEKTRDEILSLCKSKNIEQLKKLLLNRLKFGTAGIRGSMGAGYSQMNDLVIIQTAQGFTIYLEQALRETVHNQGVVIGYDGRHNSRRWAELTAAILLNHNIPVYLYSATCPTPFVAYAVLYYKCAAGVMVTASHNPKIDNGFKVYWDNGAQIISPHDKDIQKSIVSNLRPWENSWDTTILSSSVILKDPLQETMCSYMKIVQQDTLNPEMNAACDIKFTYTPMHGVGYPFMVQAFKIANFKPFVVVEEQKDPDPEFSTVKFPNPEEGKSALNLAMETANKNDSTVILANDPDADRMAVAEKQSDGEQGWYIFTGNELGSLLGWWCWHSYRQRNPGEDPSNLYMLASTVSSKLLKTMASTEGFQFFETLTGFKWIGNKTAELQKEGKKVIFAFEEAIGFMCYMAVLDKDGISSAIRAAEMVVYLNKKGMSLMDKLQELYSTYGFHISNNSYFLCYEQPIILQIFERLRNFSGSTNTYSNSILDGKYEIISVRDLTTGFDSSQPDKKAVLPVSKSNQMITFSFKNGLVATLRTSGTEPKIKYYTELCASPMEKNLEVIKVTLDEMVGAIVEEFLQPEENCLIARNN